MKKETLSSPEKIKVEPATTRTDTPQTEVGSVFALIIKGAFAPDAALGGVIGVLIQGLRRAAYSNEAGNGSASIAHSAAKTDEPVREGIVAMIGPFIDTILVCSITGIVILLSNEWSMPTIVRNFSFEYGSILPSLGGTIEGAVLTQTAFSKYLAVVSLLNLKNIESHCINNRSKTGMNRTCVGR